MLLKTLAIQALVLVFFTISGLSAQANIFIEDLRQDVFPVPLEFQPIGVLRTIPDDERWGTAFLVGQCHILTAFHVAFPNHEDENFIPSGATKSSFHVGRTGESRNSPSGFSGRSLATPVAWGSYNTQTYSGLEGDWALLRLDDCLGRRFGSISLFPPISYSNERTNNIHSASFPQDRSDQVGLTVEKNCRVRDFGPGLLSGIDCAITVGASGGPILEEADGQFYAVGIVIREMNPQPTVLQSYEASSRNMALLSEAFVKDVRAVLDSEIVTTLFGQESNPEVARIPFKN